MPLAKTIGKNISKNLSGKYSQNFFYRTKQSVTDALKTVSKRAIQKTAKATVDLIGNKIVDKITKIPKTSQQNNSETVTNEHDKNNLKKDISPKERQNPAGKYWCPVRPKDVPLQRP